MCERMNLTWHWDFLSEWLWKLTVSFYKRFHKTLLAGGSGSQSKNDFWTFWGLIISVSQYQKYWLEFIIRRETSLRYRLTKRKVIFEFLKIYKLNIFIFLLFFPFQHNAHMVGQIFNPVFCVCLELLHKMQGFF